MKKRLTIHDIARLAQVSPATVSRVLNGTARVEPEKHARVMQVIKENDFVPSINATGLKGRSQLIGMLMPRLIWTALLEMMWVVSMFLNRDRHYDLVFYSYQDEDIADTLEQVVRTERVAGLFVTLFNQTPEMMAQLDQLAVPLVLVDPISVSTSQPRICVDHYGGACIAVQHLLDLGHTRIGYIHGMTSTPCSWERYQGYCDTLRAAGIEPEAELFYQGQFDAESGIEAAHYLLSLSEPPSAIFATNDPMADGVLEVAERRGLRVPEDLAVVGFNDDPQFVSRSIGLTTIQQPYSEMAHLGIEWLFSLIVPNYTFSEEWWRIIKQAKPSLSLAEIEEGKIPSTIQLPTRLVIRQSCGSPPHHQEKHPRFLRI